MTVVRYKWCDAKEFRVGDAPQRTKHVDRDPYAGRTLDRLLTGRLIRTVGSQLGDGLYGLINRFIVAGCLCLPVGRSVGWHGSWADDDGVDILG